MIFTILLSPTVCVMHPHPPCSVSHRCSHDSKAIFIIQIVRESILRLMLIVKKNLSNRKQIVKATKQCWSYSSCCQVICQYCCHRDKMFVQRFFSQHTSASSQHFRAHHKCFSARKNAMWTQALRSLMLQLAWFPDVAYPSFNMDNPKFIYCILISKVLVNLRLIVTKNSAKIIFIYQKNMHKIRLYVDRLY